MPISPACCGCQRRFGSNQLVRDVRVDMGMFVHDVAAPIEDAVPTHPPSKESPMSTYTVGYIVGSLSSTSINRILAKALIRLAPDDLSFVEIPIGNLPLYSQDYDADYPPEGRALKEAIAAAHAILFVTPEYKRSIPGALKNAIDWLPGHGDSILSTTCPLPSSAPPRVRLAQRRVSRASGSS